MLAACLFFLYVAGCRQQCGIFMIPAALLACLNFLFYMHAAFAAGRSKPSSIT
jgi:hypothetical protein